MGSYQSISAEEVKKRMEEGEKVFLIDVRTPGEYAQKHIPKSVSIPLDRLEEDAVKIIPEKAAPIIVYCQSGSRSAKGASILTKLGYSNVSNLGGIMGWPYKTETGNGKNA